MAKYKATADFETYGDSPKNPRQVRAGEVIELNDKQAEILKDKIELVGSDEAKADRVSPSEEAKPEVDVDDTRSDNANDARVAPANEGGDVGGQNIEGPKA